MGETPKIKKVRFVKNCELQTVQQTTEVVQPASWQGREMEFSEYIRTPKVEEATLEGSSLPSQLNGSACLTGHHMILYSHSGDNAEHWILHKNVDAVERRFGYEKNYLVLKCKDFETYHLMISNQEDANNIANSIETLSSMENVTLLYPFFYKPRWKSDVQEHGLGNVKEQFEKLSKIETISFQLEVQENSDQWRISEANAQYKVCRSYPPHIIVPLNISDQMVARSAEFRHGRRFPTLSYCHYNGRVLMRSGQPLSGANGRRCKEDEKLINVVLGSTHRGYIMDTRSQQVVTQARSKGGGSETEFNYPQWRKIHHNLQRYNVQLESLSKVVEASRDKFTSADKWLTRLEASNWLGHVKQTLAAACLVAQCLDQEGASVLVHGSEGLDSTLQVTSLTQVILDPECRTIRGFLDLIEREWIQGGHPFHDRCFNSAYSTTKRGSEGPAFTVFLDCVHQLLHQFPLSFQFSSSLLLLLNQHAYASPFGTFLCNCELDRKTNRVKSKCASLWMFLLSGDEMLKWLNPVYQQRTGPTWPSVAPQSIVLWEGMFLPGVDPSAQKDASLREAVTQLEQLRDRVRVIRQDIALLENTAPASCSPLTS